MLTPPTSPEPTSPEPPPSAPDPARAAFLVQSVARIAAAVTDQMLQELQAPSTDSPSSPVERLMLQALRPWMPRLRAALLSRLSELDAASLERNLDALAGSVDELLDAAPGERTRPRYLFRWDPTTGGLILVPRDG